jgi:hypothetical protein
MYFKVYYFYFERKQEGIGPLLKYGRVGKPTTTCLDLGSG